MEMMVGAKSSLVSVWELCAFLSHSTRFTRRAILTIRHRAHTHTFIARPFLSGPHRDWNVRACVNYGRWPAGVKSRDVSDRRVWSAPPPPPKTILREYITVYIYTRIIDSE